MNAFGHGVVQGPLRRRATGLSAALGFTICLALVASGCSSSNGSGTSDSVRGETITVLDNAEHTQFKTIWQRIPQFEKKYGVKVKLVLAPETAQVEQKALTGLALGNTSYDVVTIPDETTAAAAHLMAPLEPFIKHSGMSVASFQRQNPAWAQKADTFDGKLVYAPFYAGAHAIVYRKKLFTSAANQKAFKSQYGYALPNPPKTSKQLLDTIRFFADPPKRYGIVFPAQGALGGGLIEEMMFLSGLNYTTPKGAALWGPDFASNKKLAVNAATWMQDLVTKYHAAPKQVTGMESTSAAAFFGDCSTAMYMDLSYLTWSTVKSSVGKCGPVGSFPIPPFTKNGGHIVSYWMHGIAAGSQHKQAAWDFIQWLDSPANLKAAAEGAGGTFVPTNNNVRSAVVHAGAIPSGVADAVAGGVPYPILSTTAEYRNQINTLNESLMGGKITPAEFVDKSAEAINHITGAK